MSCSCLQLYHVVGLRHNGPIMLIQHNLRCLY